MDRDVDKMWKDSRFTRCNYFDHIVPLLIWYLEWQGSY